MKRTNGLIAILVLLPAMVFAQLSIGPAINLKSPVLVGQEVNIDEVNVDQFSFGANARYRRGWFQAETLMLFSAGKVDSLDLFLDLGVALDINILTFSLGMGPNFTNNFNEARALQAGMNAKLGADFRLNRITIGTSYIMALDISENRIMVEKSSGLLGFHVLFEL